MANVTITIPAQAFRWGIACLALCLAASDLGSENVTLSTYYPAPSGVYARMITTQETYLARDPGGFVVVGSAAAPPAGVVLDVGGLMRVVNRPALPGLPGANGLIYYDTNNNAFKGSSAQVWQRLATPSCRSVVKLFTDSGNFGGQSFSQGLLACNPDEYLLTGGVNCELAAQLRSYPMTSPPGLPIGWAAACYANANIGTVGATRATITITCCKR